MNNVINLLRLTRPRQWVKNCFVFMGILFANAWHDRQMVKHVLMAALAFSLVASGVYIVNDLLDREQDVLRILAGTTGVGIAPSPWLLLCGLMVALFLGFAKRRAELYASVEGSTGDRKITTSWPRSLAGYF